MNRVPQKVIDRVDERDSKTDRMTGHFLGDGRNLHHRKMRSQGGKHTAANLVTLSGSGTVGSHGFVHSHPLAARKLGFIVPSWVHDPCVIPIYICTAGGWQRWMRFLDDGAVMPVEDDDVYAVMFEHGIWQERETAPHLLGPSGGRISMGRS